MNKNSSLRLSKHPNLLHPKKKPQKIKEINQISDDEYVNYLENMD